MNICRGLLTVIGRTSGGRPVRPAIHQASQAGAVPAGRNRTAGRSAWRCCTAAYMADLAENPMKAYSAAQTLPLESDSVGIAAERWISGHFHFQPPFFLWSKEPTR
jgi:hypothetical protein